MCSGAHIQNISTFIRNHRKYHGATRLQRDNHLYAQAPMLPQLSGCATCWHATYRKTGDTPTRTVPVLGIKEALVGIANEGVGAVIAVHIYAQDVTKICGRKRIVTYISCEHESTVTSDTDAPTTISSIMRAGALPGKLVTVRHSATWRRQGYRAASAHRAAARSRPAPLKSTPHSSRQKIQLSESCKLERNANDGRPS
jgi:hypothetical protein